MSNMEQSEAKPVPRTIEVFPPAGRDNEQPVQTNWIDVSGGDMYPLTVHFYFLSTNIWRAMVRGDKRDDIERVSDDHVIFRCAPASSVTLPLSTATDLIVLMYANLRNSVARDSVDKRLAEIKTKEAEGA